MPQKNSVNPNLVNPNLVNPNLVNPNLVNPNLVNPNLVNPPASMNPFNIMETKIDSNKNENISISQDNEKNERPSSLPSDISSNISSEDINKLMLTDESDEEDILNRFNDFDKEEEKEEKVIDKSMTVNELKKISASMNLPVSGNKTKLIERIQGNK